MNTPIFVGNFRPLFISMAENRQNVFSFKFGFAISSIQSQLKKKTSGFGVFEYDIN